MIRVRLWGNRDHQLDGFGGTWSRKWTFGAFLGPFSVSMSLRSGRIREKPLPSQPTRPESSEFSRALDETIEWLAELRAGAPQPPATATAGSRPPSSQRSVPSATAMPDTASGSSGIEEA